MITLENIQKNLYQNKIFVTPPNVEINNIIYHENESIFSNILMKNILHNKFNKSSNYSSSNYSSSNNSSNYSSSNKFLKNNKIESKVKVYSKYKKNTFILELVECLYERALLDNPCIREFKEKFLSFVNDPNNLQYLKTYSRSHKKLQSKLNNLINYDNTDDYIKDFPEFMKIICRLFNCNILIISDNIYKLYRENDNIYLVFYRHQIKEKKIYKFDNDYNNITEILQYKIKYYNEKELNKLKINELKSITRDFRLIQSKKSDIINEINKICCNF